MPCPRDKIVYDAELNAYICVETGEVLDERPIVSVNAGEEENEGNGLLVDNTIHDYGIGTDISYLSYGESRAVTMHHVLREMAKRLGLPKYVQEDSAKLIRVFLKKKFTAGRRMEELVAAVIYASIRRYGLPIGLEAFCRELNVDKRRVWNFYKAMVKEFGLKQEFIPLHIYVVQVVSRMGIEYRDYQPIIDSILSRLPTDLKYKKPDVVAQSVVLIAYLIKKGSEARE